MNYSLKIFSVFGIPIELHISFLLLMLAIYFVALFNLIPGVSLTIAVLITLLFVAVVIHELCHCYVAVGYGVEIEKVVLLPIGGVSQMKELPKESSSRVKDSCCRSTLKLSNCWCIISVLSIFWTFIIH